MPDIEEVPCVVWGSKGYGKTELRDNLRNFFGEEQINLHDNKDYLSTNRSGDKDQKKSASTRMIVTSRAWIGGLSADTIGSLDKSYPIKITLKEIRNSSYSLKSDYYMSQVFKSKVIIYVIDSTARWEIHRERPLFEAFLDAVYGDQTGPPLVVVFTKCDLPNAEPDYMEEVMGLTERSWSCWQNIPDYRVLKIQNLDVISDDIHKETSKSCKRAYDMRNTMATIIILAQNNAPMP